jgi:hypothetical protein
VRQSSIELWAFNRRKLEAQRREAAVNIRRGGRKLQQYTRGYRRPDPATLAALTIICVKFLGLQPIDAFYALLGATKTSQVVDLLIERKAALKAGA